MGAKREGLLGGLAREGEGSEEGLRSGRGSVVGVALLRDGWRGDRSQGCGDGDSAVIVGHITPLRKHVPGLRVSPARAPPHRAGQLWPYL